MRTLYVRRVPTPIYRALERRARERGSSVSAETIRLLGRALRADRRSEEHTSELQSRLHLVCRLLLEKKNTPPLDPEYPFPYSGSRGAGSSFPLLPVPRQGLNRAPASAFLRAVLLSAQFCIVIDRTAH